MNGKSARVGVLIVCAAMSFPNLVRNAHAQDTKAQTDSVDEDASKKPDPVRKLRQESLLRRNKPFPEAPDLRGGLERYRDREIIKHYTRVAQLDLVERLGAEQDETALLESGEAVRRKEVARFWRQMNRLRELGLEALARGIPSNPDELVSMFGVAQEDLMSTPKPNDVYKNAFARAEAEISSENAPVILKKLERQIDVEGKKVP